MIKEILNSQLESEIDSDTDRFKDNDFDNLISVLLKEHDNKEIDAQIPSFEEINAKIGLYNINKIKKKSVFYKYISIAACSLLIMSTMFVFIFRNSSDAVGGAIFHMFKRNEITVMNNGDSLYTIPYYNTAKKAIKDFDVNPFIPMYIPEDYLFDKIMRISDHSYVLCYEGINKDDYLTISCSNSNVNHSSKIMIFSQNDSELLEILGSKAYYNDNGINKILVFELNEVVINITGQVEKEEIIDIAKSVIPIEY